MTAPIYDPACPPLIFDGQVNVYSTCRDCGSIMQITNPDNRSHPCCATVETVLESLADLWLEETRNGADDRAADTEQLMAEVHTLEMGEAATTYADWGWPVFPLATLAKQPAIPKAKGGKGFKDATTDVSRIERWWSRHPDHNIGIATGHMFDVIDIDTKDHDGNPSPEGVMSLMKLLGAHHIPDAHAIAVTASGGLHFYVKPTGKGNRGSVRPGIDYRGLGGYVVAPPSRLAQPGRAWEWQTEPSPIIKGDY